MNDEGYTLARIAPGEPRVPIAGDVGPRRSADRPPLHPDGQRPSLRSRGFTQLVRGYGDDARGPRVPGFLLLPPEAVAFEFVNRVGRGTGRPRYENAVLARLAWLYARSRGERAPMRFADGVELTLPDGVFVASIQGLAVSLWERLFRRRVPAGGVEDLAFSRFYKRIQGAVERLEEARVSGLPLVRRLGPAREDVEGKARDLFGFAWTLRGTLLEERAGTLPAARVPLLSREQPPLSPGTVYVEECADATGNVDVLAGYDRVVRGREELLPAYTEAAVKVGGFARRERPRTFRVWQARQAAKPQSKPCHLSVGVWQPGDACAEDRHDRPCTVPYLVGEIDAPHPEGSYELARLLVERLRALGVDPRRIVVAYSGNRSFHVRIPHSLVGCPVYTRAGDAAPVIRRFFEALAEGVEGPGGALIGYLDPSLFSPLHLIRAVGSPHDKRPDYFCVAFTGAELLGLDFDTVETYSRVYSRFKLPDPDKGDPCPALAGMLDAAAVGVARPEAATRRPSGGVIDRIRRGVSPGEEFAPGHVGRSKAAFLLSLYLLTCGRLGEHEAWTELERWNREANPAPIGTLPGDSRLDLLHSFRSALRASARPRSTPR